MQNSPISTLLAQQMNGSLSEAQQKELAAILADEANAEAVKQHLEALLQQAEPDAAYNEAAWAAMAQNIVAIDKAEPTTVVTPKPVLHRVHFLKRSWFRFAAVAVLLVGLGIGIRSFYQQQKRADIVRRIEASKNNDAPPGGNKALLTLADGTTIVLDSAANGQLASQGNVKIFKLQNGQLKFVIGQSDATNSTTASQINTITTPRGGQYQLELPDGTHIWLNAATSLHFPTAFTGNKRQVKLEGEAYFEVAKDAAHPFEVAAGGTNVEVLGTHFNVNAYPDEKAVTTTLLEGKVQVQTSGKQVELQPGNQCQSANGSNSLNAHADTEEATAWKNGQFQFSGADVQSILRQVSRWYGVEVNYTDGIPTAHITGEMPRTLTLKQVMEVLQESGISLWLEDNGQLYVAPGQ